MIRERERNGLPGIPVLLLLFLAGIASIALFAFGIGAPDGHEPYGWIVAGAVLLFISSVFLTSGVFVVAPNSARVLQLFGDYVGTAKSPGLRWANPFYTKKRISLRVRNFESSHLKVNDADGNPIEIAAVVVWRVVDTAEASFEVDNYENYVHVQSEAAVRNAATSYPYDAHDDAMVSLRGSTDVVAEQLKREDAAAAAEGGRRGARGAHQPPRLRARDRRGDAAAPAGGRDHRRARSGSWKARWAWWRWRSTCCRTRASSSSTRSARRRWSATCSSCCAARGARSRSSTPARSTSRRAARGWRANLSCSHRRSVLEAMQRWANDDLRSLNGQIEFVLRDALRRGGTLQPARGPDTARRAAGRSRRPGIRRTRLHYSDRQ